MKTLEQIKNDYAVDLGYLNWESLMTEVCYFSNEEFFEHENEVMKIYAMECLKLASENAFDHFIAVSDRVQTNVRKAITNENNILK